jgi:hypothetical protein
MDFEHILWERKVLKFRWNEVSVIISKLLNSKRISKQCVYNFSITLICETHKSSL